MTLTSNELKECMKTREPIEGYYDQCREWCEFAYIDSVITRYNVYSSKFEIVAVLMDKNLNSTFQQTPDKIRRIHRPAEPKDVVVAKSATTRTISKTETVETLAEIQERTLKRLKEDVKRNR